MLYLIHLFLNTVKVFSQEVLSSYEQLKNYIFLGFGDKEEKVAEIKTKSEATFKTLNENTVL